MTWYTVQAGYAGYFANTVSVEADSVDDALQKSVEEANNDPNWKSVDHCGSTFVDAYCVGRDEDPWDSDKSLPVPARFTEQGEPPLVTLTGPNPPGGIEVADGAVRIRFVDRAARVTAEVSDPPPPPQNKPVVTVTRRPDGTPDIDVRGGKAIVRVEGWQQPIADQDAD